MDRVDAHGKALNNSRRSAELEKLAGAAKPIIHAATVRWRSMLRVNIRRRRGWRLARQHFELGFDEAGIAPTVVFLGQPTRANIAGAVDQKLSVRFGNPDHVLFPVVKGAGE